MKKYSFAGAALTALIAAMVIWFNRENSPIQLKESLKEVVQNILRSPGEEYGIQHTDLNLCTERVRPNESIGSILAQHGITYDVVHDIAQRSSEIFDVRNLRVGKQYCILKGNDSLNQMRYFIYEQDPINFIVYEFGDSIRVFPGKKKVEERKREASGVIYSSLWKTLLENRLDPNIAINLSEIFAWSVDFYRIQKGDRFRILFNEKYVDGERVGVGEIEAAWFQHAGKEFYAIPFAQGDKKIDYFDQDGTSLRKAFLKAPLKFRRVSSRFNRRRFHPVLKRRRPHLGTDYAAATGTPVWSVADGVVTRKRYTRGGGNNVEIRHNGTYSTRYLHFSKFARNLKVGQHVSQGQIIGYVGSTGLATGPHLHFEMIKNGKHVDAIREEVPPGDPVAAEYQKEFEEIRNTLITKLDAIPIEADAPESASNH